MWWWTAPLALALLVACGAAGAPADPVAEGRRAYSIYCIGCHSLAAGGPTALGPPLAGVAARAAANGEGLSAAEWLRREIVDPEAALTPGYSGGLMPPGYGRDLRPAQIDGLVAYLLTVGADR